MKSSTKNQAWSVFKRKGGHLFNKKIPRKGKPSVSQAEKYTCKYEFYIYMYLITTI